MRLTILNSPGESSSGELMEWRVIRSSIHLQILATSLKLHMTYNFDETLPQRSTLCISILTLFNYIILFADWASLVLSPIGQLLMDTHQDGHMQGLPDADTPKPSCFYIVDCDEYRTSFCPIRSLRQLSPCLSGAHQS